MKNGILRQTVISPFNVQEAMILIKAGNLGLFFFAYFMHIVIRNLY